MVFKKDVNGPGVFEQISGSDEQDVSIITENAFIWNYSEWSSLKLWEMMPV